MKLRMNQCDEVNPFDGEVEVPDHVGHLLLVDTGLAADPLGMKRVVDLFIHIRR